VRFGIKQAFSTIELMLVLALISALIGIFVAKFRVESDQLDDISSINRALKHARLTAISTNQPIRLSYASGTFFMLNDFGEKISEFRCNLRDNNSFKDPRNVTKFDESGFFIPFSIKCGSNEYHTDILSGMLCEKAQ
jgi:Tfp pilus assembly protein FimT